jgi:hypothetical protein
VELVDLHRIDVPRYSQLDDEPLATASGVVTGVVFSLVVLWPPIVIAACYAVARYS